MNRILKDENRLQKWVVVLLLLMGVPAFAWGQKKTKIGRASCRERV